MEIGGFPRYQNKYTVAHVVIGCDIYVNTIAGTAS